MTDPRHRTYTGWDIKPVEVEVNGRWYWGELRSWDQADDGTWSAIVSWQKAPGMRRIDRFPTAGIRPL